MVKEHNHVTKAQGIGERIRPLRDHELAEKNKKKVIFARRIRQARSQVPY
jgi:hypothetical protein